MLEARKPERGKKRMPDLLVRNLVAFLGCWIETTEKCSALLHSTCRSVRCFIDYLLVFVQQLCGMFSAVVQLIASVVVVGKLICTLVRIRIYRRRVFALVSQDTLLFRRTDPVFTQRPNSSFGTLSFLNRSYNFTLSCLCRSRSRSYNITT